MPTPNLALLVTQQSPIQQLHDRLRQLRAGTAVKQMDTGARNVAKEVLTKGRYKPAEHLLTIAFDALDRGGRLEDAEAFGHQWNAIMRDRYASIHGANDFDRLTLAEVHLAEERAQGEREVAETCFGMDPSICNLTVLLRAIAVHEEATAQYVAFLRYLHVGGQDRVAARCGRGARCG